MRLFRRRPEPNHPEETHSMSQSQYGPQGTPVTVQPPTAAVQPSPVAPESVTTPEPADLPGDAAIAYTGEAETAIAEPETAEALGERFADLQERLRAAEATVAAARALVPRWEHVASRTLQRGKYDEGNRDAVMACADDLRKVVGD